MVTVQIVGGANDGVVGEVRRYRDHVKMVNRRKRKKGPADHVPADPEHPALRALVPPPTKPAGYVTSDMLTTRKTMLHLPAAPTPTVRDGDHALAPDGEQHFSFSKLELQVRRSAASPGKAWERSTHWGRVLWRHRI